MLRRHRATDGIRSTPRLKLEVRHSCRALVRQGPVQPFRTVRRSQYSLSVEVSAISQDQILGRSLQLPNIVPCEDMGLVVDQDQHADAGVV